MPVSSCIVIKENKPKSYHAAILAAVHGIVAQHNLLTAVPIAKIQMWSVCYFKRHSNSFLTFPLNITTSMLCFTEANTINFNLILTLEEKL